MSDAGSVKSEAKVAGEVKQGFAKAISTIIQRTGGEEVKTTLETSREDAKLHSKRVGNMRNYTRNEWGRCVTTL
jgi:hypothetical protein